MQIVEAMVDADVFDAAGGAAYLLRAGERYVVYDSEAGLGLRQGAFRSIAGVDRVLSPYNREPLRRQRLVLPFIGRLGDAVVTASCVTALKERYPDIRVDIAAVEATRGLFELMPRVGQLLPYPLEASRLADYDYYLSFESVEAVPDGSARPCADVFSSCLRTPRPAHPPTVTIPREVVQRWRLEKADRPRVAVHVGRPGSLRSFPADLFPQLIRRLAADGYGVYLVGDQAGADVSPGNVDLCYDCRDRTPTPADLAALLGQMDVVVTGDSFPMHLAGAMGVATVAIFTATDAVLASDYPSVTGVQSRESCSPCRVADGRCPLGHAECTAHRHSSVSADSIVALVAELVGC